MKLSEALIKINKHDIKIISASEKRWDSIAKPLKSLGRLEAAVTKIAGIKNCLIPRIDKKALIVFCADNGIVEEGVTQTDSSVTAVVSENFAKGATSACVMSKIAGVDIYPVDIGIACEVTGLINKKIMLGTKNFLKSAAMTREETIEAIEVGIDMAEELYQKGYDIICTGEMGIGNTATSSAVASVMLSMPPREITGRGAGLSDNGLEHKIEVIQSAIDLHKPDKNDVIDVLMKVGGLDIAGMVGAFIGGAALRIPVIIDGFISSVAALCAVTLNKNILDFILPSHMSKEGGMRHIFDALGIYAPIDANMCLGEGTGAIAVLPLYEMGLAVYREMSTFNDIEIEEYKHLE